MDNVSLDSVIVFVRAEAGLGQSRALVGTTRLWDDLDLTGDEANDFIGEFFERFGVDPGDFDFHRYFLMEGEGLLYSLLRRAILRKSHTLRREPITINMLYRAALDWRWDSRTVESV